MTLQLCARAFALLSALALLHVDHVGAQDPLDTTGIRGSGSTFVYPLLSAWSREYRAFRARGGKYPTPNAGLDSPLPSSALDYEAVGSFAGMQRAKDRSVDFGASDMPLSPDDLAKFQLGQFPIVLGGVAIAAELDGLGATPLRLSGPVLAKIFLGEISRWSDPALKALNPTLNLPDATISVIYRSEGSGTTFNFTEYLSRVSPEWKRRIGSGLHVTWPAGRGVEGNEGVAQTVRSTHNAIGYVEYTQAKQLGLHCASLQNRAGLFVEPSHESFRAAADGGAMQPRDDWSNLLLDTPAPDAYPLTATVFVLMHKQARRHRTRATLEFFAWSLAHGDAAAARLGYVPVPAAWAQQVTEYWQKTFGVQLSLGDF